MPLERAMYENSTNKLISTVRNLQRQKGTLWLTSHTQAYIRNTIYFLNVRQLSWGSRIQSIPSHFNIILPSIPMSSTW